MNDPRLEDPLPVHHDNVPPQMPFSKDTRKPDGKDASPKSAPAPETETQGENNDYYNGMSQ